MPNAPRRPKKPIPDNRLEQLRNQRGWSMEKLGEMIGKDASYINKLEKRSQGIPWEMLQQLALALDVSVDEIIPLSAPERPTAETHMIPIYGTAAGSHLRGAAQTLEGPVDRIEAPKALQNAKGVYGIYVVGSSMEPMFRHGALLVVSPYKPPRQGDAVVVQEQKTENGPLEATLGLLERIGSDRVALRKLNPATTIELNATYVKSVHKVLDHGEILGVS